MSLLPLDLHAHIVPGISAQQLDDLDSVVLAVTRSTSEYMSITERSHPLTMWGIGCHPGLVRVQNSYSEELFREMVEQTPVIGEVGLDGSSRVPIQKQREVFKNILRIAADSPRIVTIHSYQATALVLEELESNPIVSPILHWWLGTPEETDRALELGCYFSVNFAQASKGSLPAVPNDRILTETDHPFGDRWSSQPRRPGNVLSAEKYVARRFGGSVPELRERVWENFSRLVELTGTAHLLGLRIKALLANRP